MVFEGIVTCTKNIMVDGKYEPAFLYSQSHWKHKHRGVGPEKNFGLYGKIFKNYTFLRNFLISGKRALKYPTFNLQTILGYFHLVGAIFAPWGKIYPLLGKVKWAAFCRGWFAFLGGNSD